MTRRTFYQMIKHYGRVEIPRIQRDYAQGRKDQHIVREDFLKSLYDALRLPEDDATLPLDLDFVYGSVVGESFRPLDGQQRLTTLFLLHWCLAWIDGRGEDLRAWIVDGNRSRFSYEVRPSSRDFINALASYSPDIPAAECPSLVELITDQPWYFRSWQLDPTIRAALSMLGRIHEIFRQTSGLYHRLIDEAVPAVTFQLLDLEQFGLSDDLYIKMNARGKPLTPFEAFKARFEKHLEGSQFTGARPALCGGTPLPKFFSHQIDTRWSDFFWPFRDRNTATFDNSIMNLLRAVIMVTRDPEAAGTDADLNDLRFPVQGSSYAWFHDRGWLDQEMILALITLLERWSAGARNDFCRYLPDTRHLDEMALFRGIISNPTNLTLQQLVQLAGYTQFLVHSTGEVDSAAFDEWMRVVSNLAVNTDYNGADDLRRSFAGLRDLAPRMNDILDYLASSDGDVRGFFRVQVAEERIKARLIGFGGDWPELIDRAERHTYFRGQVGFLLRCCGLRLSAVAAEVESALDLLDESDATKLAQSFEFFQVRASQMFDDLAKDPKGAGRRWERALLAVGDFLPEVGGNRSLLTMSSDEAWGWKRLLRDASAEGHRPGLVLKKLWERLGDSDSYAADLEKIVKKAVESKKEIDPWRHAIIANLSVYGYYDKDGYGAYRMMRFSDNGRIYLLKKKRMSSTHVELFSYSMLKHFRSSMKKFGFDVSYYDSTSYEEPGLCFRRVFDGRTITFYYCLNEDTDRSDYEFYLYEPKKPRRRLLAILERLEFVKKDGYFTKEMEHGDILWDAYELGRAFQKEEE